VYGSGDVVGGCSAVIDLLICLSLPYSGCLFDLNGIATINNTSLRTTVCFDCLSG